MRFRFAPPILLSQHRIHADVKSSAIEKIYLQHNDLPNVLNKNISAKGTLKEICSNDGGTCYPLIDLEEFQLH
ncbi:MAG: hypothetical protein UT02_C0002G0042 [Parcubacteria group bacterium GW2011_GWC2_38_7]|nr:MAG: hypothetical protein UT02_C0002G0042 [Parcubacteria group bacterium GW2011_GWC2_38_7]